MTLRKRWHEEKLDIETREFASTFLCGAAIGLLFGIALGAYLAHIYLNGA
jgi:tetrahydromethanopterin S-methyltransferase subunit G